MSTPTPPGWLMAIGTVVVVNPSGSGQKAPRRTITGYVKPERSTWCYLLEGEKNPVPSVNVTKVPPDPYPAEEGGRPTTEADHWLTVDLPGAPPDPEKYTPAFAADSYQQHRQRVLKGVLPSPLTPAVTYSAEVWEKFGRLSLDNPTVDDRGISVTVTVRSNPGHRADPYDMVTVRLEAVLDTTLDSIAVLTPGKEQSSAGVRLNIARFDLAYTWSQLARLLGADLQQTPDPRAFVTSKVARLGLRADWYTATRKNAKNTYLHRSGGPDNKDNTGLLRLRPLTLEEYAAADSQRRLEWNLSEELTTDRPVFRTHHGVLQPGRELATTIEAEAEYNVSREQHDDALQKLATLAKDAQAAQKYGILAVASHGEKATEDTYYDTAEKDLLSRGIVLRRRHVTTDPDGTFLFSVKGRTVTFGKENFRLASQVHLSTDPTSDQVGAFCLDVSTADNAFARVLRDALGPDWDRSLKLQTALTVHSTRVKYSLQLDNGTTIEFSADTSYGEAPGKGKARSETIHCVELGVGHPGLTVADVVGSGASSSPQPAVAQPPLFTRTYHVPADLTGELLKKSDFLQFTELRTRLVPYLLGSGPLHPGGNKAQLLARALKLIS